MNDKFLKGSSYRSVIESRKYLCRFGQDFRTSIRGQSIEHSWFSDELFSNIVTLTRAEAIEEIISKRLTSEFDGRQVATMYWFPYILHISMDSEIIAGQQSGYNSNDEIRFIATNNMVSHGGLSDISVEGQKPVYKLLIGMLDFHGLFFTKLRCLWRKW